MTIVLDKIHILNFFQRQKKKKKSIKYIIINPREIKLGLKKNNRALDCIPRFLIINISLEARVIFKVSISFNILRTHKWNLLKICMKYLSDKSNDLNVF